MTSIDTYVRTITAVANDDVEADARKELQSTFKAKQTRAAETKSAVEAAINALDEKKALDACLSAYNKKIESLKAEKDGKIAALIKENTSAALDLSSFVDEVNAASQFVAKKLDATKRGRVESFIQSFLK